MNRAVAIGFVALVISASTVAGILVVSQWGHERELHPWVLGGTDPGRVDDAMRRHADKLPGNAEALFDFASEGLLRAVVTVSDRAAAEEFVEGHVTMRTWLGGSPRLVAAVTPDQFADLLTSRHVQAVEPDFPIRFLSSDSTQATKARSLHDGTSGQGTGVWTYNAGSDELESDGLGMHTGKGVAVAVIDSGIDKTHPDFYAWHCAPESTEQALQWHLDQELHGIPPPCPSRIKAAVKVTPLPHWADFLDAGVGDLVEVQVDDRLPTTDHGALGHGTHVAGIAAGNGHASRQQPDASVGGDGRAFGVAPEADIVSVAIGDTEHAWYGAGSTTNGFDVTEPAWYTMAIVALEWTLDHAKDYNIRVVLNAWACVPSAGNAFGSASQQCDGEGRVGVIGASNLRGVSAIVKALYDDRLVVVFANGEMTPTSYNPGGRDAWNPHALAVGAYDDATGTVAEFSRPCARAVNGLSGCPNGLQDPKDYDPTNDGGRKGPDLLAPGVDIWSARNLLGTPVGQGKTWDASLAVPNDIIVDLDEVDGLDPTDPTASVHGLPRTGEAYYDRLSGNSMAAAHVAGAATILMQACPGATALDVMRALFVGADNSTFEAYDGDVHGYGALDVRASLAWLLDTVLACQTTERPQITSHRFDSLGVSFPGTPVMFGATATDNDGRVVSWEWDFGDGNTIVIDTPEGAGTATTAYTYAEPGTYEVNLTVSDDRGARDRHGPTTVVVFDQPKDLVESRSLRVTCNSNACGATDVSGIDGMDLPGSGTEDDPYVIENLEISLEVVKEDGPGFGTRTIGATVRNEVFGIHVVDTGSKHLLIRNVSIHASHAEGTTADDVDTSGNSNAGIPYLGIHLGGDAKNVRLEDIFVCGTPQRPINNGIVVGGDNNHLKRVHVCYASRNANSAGIFVDNASGNTVEDCHAWKNTLGLLIDRQFSRNLKITGCTVFSNDTGVRVDSSAKSNKIFNNAIFDNRIDGGTTNDNEWNVDPTKDDNLEKTNILGQTGLGGNFWGSYGGVDEECNFSQDTHCPHGRGKPDGFGDAAYGSGKDKDEYPLVKATPPVEANFTLLTPGVTSPNETYDVVIVGEAAQLGDRSKTPGSIPVAWRWSIGQTTLFTTDHTTPLEFTFDPARTPNCLIERKNWKNSILNITDHLDREGEVTRDLCITHRPTADFTVTSQGWNIFLDTRCHASTAPCSKDPDGEAIEYAWSFFLDGEELDPAKLTFPRDDPGLGEGNRLNATTPRSRAVVDGGGTVNVRLTVTDPNGAAAIAEKEVVLPEDILPSPPLADFQATATTTSVPVMFEELSEDINGDTITGWKWDFGDGSTIGDLSVDTTGSLPPCGELLDTMCQEDGRRFIYHKYARSGTYQVTLQAQSDDDFGYSPVEEKFVPVLNAPPIPVFTVQSSGGTDIRTVDVLSFDGAATTDLDGSVTWYAWDLDGDGDVDQQGDSLDFLTYSYAANGLGGGTYAVNLTATDDEGGTAWFVQSITVVNTAPIASFSWSPQHPTTRDTIAFTDHSMDPDQFVAASHWDFGDGKTSTSLNPKHQFTSAGTYDVALTVTDNQGGVDTIMHRITVTNNLPAVDFSATPAKPTVLDTIHFKSLAEDESGISQTTWDFGDGNTTTGTAAKHRYHVPGTYPVTLTVVDGDGGSSVWVRDIVVLSAAPIAAFTWDDPAPTTADEILFKDASTDPDGVVVAWQWDFGDGTTSTQTDPVHRFVDGGAYDVTLTVTDNAGRAASTKSRISIANLAPVASPTATPQQPNLGQVVHFAANAVDSDGTILAYRWDFGDGAAASGASTSHAYQEKGAYTVVLSTMDDDGAVAKSQLVVRVTNIPPTTDFTHTPIQPTTSDGVRFEATTSDEDGTIISWQWDFGDGQSSSRRSPTHSYARAGNYTVVLTVTDSDGDTESAQHDVVVINTPPEVDIRYRPESPATQDRVRFTGVAADSDGKIVSWSWDFGDGNTSAGDDVEHQFHKPGTYLVRLSVTDDEGSIRSADRTVQVRSTPPVPEMKMERGGDTVMFKDRSRDPDGVIVSRMWDFGDGRQAEGQEVQHRFDEPGGYIVTLTVTDDAGDAATVSRHVLVEGDTPRFLESPDPSKGIPAPLVGPSILFGLIALRLSPRRP